MKNRSPLFTVALALTGILIISVGLIALGSRETRAFPSANSYAPSGSAAFAELLRRSGYEVVVDDHPTPSLHKGDLAIAFYSVEPNNTSISDEADEAQISAAKNSVQKFVQSGGHLLALPYSPDFQTDSLMLYEKKVPIQSESDAAATATWDRQDPAGSFIDGDKNTEPLWGTRQATFAALAENGKGQDATVANGIVAMNRFLDRAQNADVLMDVVGTLASPGSRVVFVEASIGNAEEQGLMDAIGPWAKAAWMQFALLCIVIIYTLGKPFGLPDPERRRERGSRELLDAMSDTLRRGRMTKLALRTVYDDTNRLLRKWFRAPRDLQMLDLQARNLTDLQRALSKLDAAADIGAPEDAAARMVQDVERLVREVGSHGTRLG